MNLGHAPILMAACGNPLAGDDAFGPLLAGLLRREPIAGVEAVDLGMNPGGLLDLLDGRLALVLADAVHVQDTAAGALIDCDWDQADRPPLASECKLSTHGLSIADQVELAGSLAMLPRIVRLVAVTTTRVVSMRSPDDATTRLLGPARECIVRLARDVFASAGSLTEMRYV
jgi:hydrogenase maturation protease